MTTTVVAATGSAAFATMVLNPFTAFSQQDKKPPYSADVVKAFVSAGHNNLAKVKEMLAEFPHLLYASWDLGNGDFEQAIDGAAHVGDREIAEYLISQGARPNIFTMTMLGETELVKAMLSKYPMRAVHTFCSTSCTTTDRRSCWSPTSMTSRCTRIAS